MSPRGAPGRQLEFARNVFVRVAARPTTQLLLKNPQRHASRTQRTSKSKKSKVNEAAFPRTESNTMSTYKALNTEDKDDLDSAHIVGLVKAQRIKNRRRLHSELIPSIKTNSWLQIRTTLRFNIK